MGTPEKWFRVIREIAHSLLHIFLQTVQWHPEVRPLLRVRLRRPLHVVRGRHGGEEAQDAAAPGHSHLPGGGGGGDGRKS